MPAPLFGSFSGCPHKSAPVGTFKPGTAIASDAHRMSSAYIVETQQSCCCIRQIGLGADFGQASDVGTQNAHHPQTVIAALQARRLPHAAIVLRDEVRPQHTPVTGLIVLPDGQPGEPEVALSLSAPRGARDRRSGGTGPPPAFDTLITSIGAALAFDPPLRWAMRLGRPRSPGFGRSAQ